jgi:hypothetical protein
MASAAFTAVSEMSPNGSRAAACNWTNDELTKALELAASAPPPLACDYETPFHGFANFEELCVASALKCGS